MITHTDYEIKKLLSIDLTITLYTHDSDGAGLAPREYWSRRLLGTSSASSIFTP